jgi:hypothetical protein
MSEIELEARKEFEPLFSYLFTGSASFRLVTKHYENWIARLHKSY